jgi:8-oxo-dGTP diphosphatase
MKDNLKFAILSTDIAVFTVDETSIKVLLTTATSDAFKGMPALPGGLVGPEEKIEDAVKRILKKVLPVKSAYLEQLYTFGDPDRDPIGRVVSATYLVLIPWNTAKLVDRQGASWRDVRSVPKLAYDHNEIVKTAVKRLVGKLAYTNIIFSLMPQEFTLTDLQKAYELILDRKLDKRNFRKKIGFLGLLDKLPKRKEGEANRPARLYSFSEKKLRELEIL